MSEITNTPDSSYSYIKRADISTFKLRILRAIIVYLPINQINSFESELRWLYRSWIYMQIFEPSKWRTDLIVFVDTNLTEHFLRSDFF